MNQKGFVNIALVVLVVVLVSVVVYLTLIKKPASTPAAPQNLSQNNVDDCNLISNSSFRSTNQYEVGLGPNGEVMGYWGITFRRNKFEWGHSDVSESGTYTCKNNVLQVKFFDHSITAHYDGSKKILTWDGVEYKKVE